MSSTVYRVGILTLSDKGARGEREDTSGPMLRRLIEREPGFRVTAALIMADEEEEIVRLLTRWVDRDGLDLILTTGGTGVSPRDRTPEATARVIDRPVPGLAEAMRQASLSKTVQAVWSRGLAGIRGQSLIVNLPGSEKAARENIEAVLPALAHGLDKIKGSTADCALLGSGEPERVQAGQD